MNINSCCNWKQIKKIMLQNGRNVINQCARGGGLVLNDNESEFITWGRAELNTWCINGMQHILDALEH